jgi:RNA polymerase sigma factor (sigma-70 family)
MKTPTHIAAENLKRGSEQAKEFIFINHYQDFLKTASRIVKSKEDAEDVVSESIFKIFNRIHQLKDPAQFLSWCRRIVVRDCYTFIKNRRVDSDLDMFDIKVYDDFTKAFDIYLIKNLITKLPSGYSEVIRLYCVEGYTGSEISKMLGIDPGTVRSQLFKGRKMLQRRLGYEY